MNVAIVHDWLYGGGAEQVVLELHKLYPEAPIYTSYCTDEWRKKLDNKVVTGYLQNWPFSALRKFLPALRQRWFSKLDLSEFDLVISSSGNGEAKFARKAPSATHICYCHTPPHFYWGKYNEYLANPSFRPKWLVQLGLRLLVKPLRKRDYQAAQAVDYFIANSTHIQNDIKQYYGRDSVVIHPPIDTERFGKIQPAKDGADFIMWGRHVPYKRFDIAIQACNQLKLPLTVIGTGPDTSRLKALAGPTIKFTDWLSDSEFEEYVSHARVFIFPGEEDFGIAPVEALAAGLLVIAYRAGGALDYVIPGKTGEFFTKQTTESLMDALNSFVPSNYTSSNIKSYAQKFSSEAFRSKVEQTIHKLDS